MFGVHNTRFEQAVDELVFIAKFLEDFSRVLTRSAWPPLDDARCVADRSTSKPGSSMVPTPSASVLATHRRPSSSLSSKMVRQNFLVDNFHGDSGGVQRAEQFCGFPPGNGVHEQREDFLVRQLISKDVGQEQLPGGFPVIVAGGGKKYPTVGSLVQPKSW